MEPVVVSKKKEVQTSTSQHEVRSNQKELHLRGKNRTGKRSALIEELQRRMRIQSEHRYCLKKDKRFYKKIEH